MPHLHSTSHRPFRLANAPLAGDLCFGRPEARIPVFRFPSKWEGMERADLGFTRDQTFKCASRVNPTCDGARELARLPSTSRLRGLQGRTSRSASTPTAISPLPGIAAVGVRAASDGGRCASRGSTAASLSGAAPRSVIKRRDRRRPR